MGTSTEPCDVVVLGAGASGLAAALSAHEHGARVRVLEKSALVGGSAAISGGVVWVPDNPAMRRAGQNDSRDAALAYFRSLAGDALDESVLTAFVDQGPEALRFLEQHTALEWEVLDGYPDYYLDRPGALPYGGRALDSGLFSFERLGPWRERVRDNGNPYRLKLGETPLGGGTGQLGTETIAQRLAADERGFGQSLVGALLEACLARDIEPELNTDVVGLQREGERVIGVEVRSESGSIRVEARGGVLICTGGFEWDEALCRTFLRGPLDAPASPPTNRGDGLRLAMSVGAQLGNMTSAWWAPTLAIPGDDWFGVQRAAPVLIERTAPHSLIVNRRGQRFCNEAANYSALAGALHYRDPNAYEAVNLPCWLVFDATFRERYPVGPLMPGQPTPAWLLERPTLAELAQALDIDADSLEATVARFNGHAAAGRDPDFERGASPYDLFYGDRSRAGTAATLGPLEKPPFFAVELKSGALGTNGGPRTDPDGRVLDVHGAVIEGLFAAGNAMAGPTAHVYAGAGGTLGPALTFGYLAGRAAARQRVNQAPRTA
ncbi:MAG: FAD-dependent oxidoreductase [Pseudomonadota bacterium]